MIGFIEDLWKSIFTPGATPTLIIATHLSFILLTVSLSIFIILTNFNFHLCNLLILSLLLWIAITWFIGELKKQESVETSNSNKLVEEKDSTVSIKTGIQTTSKSNKKIRSRKV